MELDNLVKKIILGTVLAVALLMVVVVAHGIGDENQGNRSAAQSKHCDDEGFSRFLSGKVIVSQKYFSPVDCFEKDCHLDQSATFFALLENSEGMKFRIVTPSETFRELHPKPLYMEEGKSYTFCASRIEEVRGDAQGYAKFFINNIETIQEKK